MKEDSNREDNFCVSLSESVIVCGQEKELKKYNAGNCVLRCVGDNRGVRYRNDSQSTSYNMLVRRTATSDIFRDVGLQKVTFGLGDLKTHCQFCDAGSRKLQSPPFPSQLLLDTPIWLSTH